MQLSMLKVSLLYNEVIVRLNYTLLLIWKTSCKNIASIATHSANVHEKIALFAYAALSSYSAKRLRVRKFIENVKAMTNNAKSMSNGSIIFW